MSDDLVNQWKRYVAANGPAQTGAECLAQRMAYRIEALEAVADAARAYVTQPRKGTHIELGNALARLDAQKDKSDD